MGARSFGRGRLIALSVLLGALAAVVVMPRLRSTIAAQAAVALGRRPEWLQAALGGPRPRMERLLAAAPDDVALQVGGATLPPVKVEPAEPDPEAPPWPPDDSKEVLTRLDEVARRFPNDAAVRAHQLRHMSPSAVRLERPEEGEQSGPHGRPAAGASRKRPAAEALRRFALAAATGQRLEPANGFFDTMRAAGAFAAHQDEEALRFLHAAALKPEWNDHAVDETRGRWKLLQAAYGDQGALQKRPAFSELLLSELLLPHYALMRATARMALWHAARRERAGDAAGGRAIRRDVMQLGVRMTEGSPLLIGKLVGIAIFQIGTSPVPTDSARRRPRPPGASPWTATRERYVARLASSGETAEAAWVRTEGKRIDATRAQISHVVQANGFLAHLQRLQAAWLVGLVLLRQIGVLLLLWAAALLLARVGGRGREARPARWIWLAVYSALFLAPCLLVAPFGSIPLLLAAQGIGLSLVGAISLARWIGRRRSGRPGDPKGDPSGGKEYAWQPALVGLAAVIPSTAILYLGWEAIGRGLSWASAIDPFRQLYGLVGMQTTSGLEVALPAVVVLPAALVALLVLCRVAALDLPLMAGLVRGVRRVVPFAGALLALLYLGSLVPTVAADRALANHLEQSITDELGSLTQRLP